MKTNYWFNRNRLLTGLRFVTALLLVPSVLLISASSSRAAQTYHGTITSGTFYCDGAPVSGPIVTGIWNVNIDPATPAQVTLNVFYNGSHHLAFGYNKLMLVSYVDGVYTFTGFGDAVTATLNTTVNPGDVRLARRTWCQLPGPKPLQLADVLWSGGPRK
jgi:hypothetical protein